MKNTILIVHYNPRDLGRMAGWAAEMGLESRTARNQDEAIDTLEEVSQIGLILIDPLLPAHPDLR